MQASFCLSNDMTLIESAMYSKETTPHKDNKTSKGQNTVTELSEASHMGQKEVPPVDTLRNQVQSFYERKTPIAELTSMQSPNMNRHPFKP